jgi:hypothetical protein
LPLLLALTLANFRRGECWTDMLLNVDWTCSTELAVPFLSFSHVDGRGGTLPYDIEDIDIDEEEAGDRERLRHESTSTTGSSLASSTTAISSASSTAISSALWSASTSISAAVAHSSNGIDATVKSTGAM